MGPEILQAIPEEAHTLPSKGKVAECMTLLGGWEVSTWFPDCKVDSEDFHCVLADGGFGVCACKFALVSLSIHHVFLCLTSHLLATYLCLARCRDPHR